MTFGQVLLLVAVAAIIVSIWLTSERQANRRFQEDDRRRQPEPPRQEDVNQRPAADFAALIDTIHNEASANRNQEKREDSGQQFRDYVTLFILVATLVALSWTCYAIIQQVREMQRVYPQISKASDGSR